MKSKIGLLVSLLVYGLAIAQENEIKLTIYNSYNPKPGSVLGNKFKGYQVNDLIRNELTKEFNIKIIPTPFYKFEKVTGTGPQFIPEGTTKSKTHRPQKTKEVPKPLGKVKERLVPVSTLLLEIPSENYEKFLEKLKTFGTLEIKVKKNENQKHIKLTLAIYEIIKKDPGYR